jgi:DNA-binding HxlR family transcriptional regulator
MYIKKIADDLDCGINVTMKVLSGKWKPCIIDAIGRGIRRPSDLHRAINEATPRVINMQLAELHRQGIVSKKIFAEIPLRVEYKLTPLGESLLPLVAMIDDWGKRNSGYIKTVSHLQMTAV